jgi:hypothetical protein
VRLRRAPTPSELADAVGVSSDELAQLESATNLNGSINEAGVAVGASEAEAGDARLMLDTFRSLNDTERAIIYQRFLRDRSRREVAEELRMSQSALARQTTVALSKLRVDLENRAFERGAPAAAGADAHSERDSGAGQSGRRRGRAEPPETPSAGAAKERLGYSGRLMLRMPQSLHAELAEAAERGQVSLNQFITDALASAVGSRSEDSPKDGGRASDAPAGRAGAVRLAIIVNVIVLAIVAAVAVVLLVIALRDGG